jgi:TctA family transporter
MKNIDMNGVLILMAHLIITLAVIGIYAYGSVTGHPDETLKTIIFAIIGYWFGAIGKDQLTKKTDSTQDETKKGA